MHPIEHLSKAIDALANPSGRPSHPNRQTSEIARRLRDSADFWPAPEQELSSMERLWREKL